MNRAKLVSLIRSRQSFLCVGLDPDLNKIPKHLLNLSDPLYEFNKAIIDATRDFCVAYKPNMAFYECLGSRGWEILEKTRAYIGSTHFTIADAKRADIGNTSTKYAETYFNAMDFDAITVAPYMGKDSVEPFFAFDQRWTILLALTSNPGAADFQLSSTHDGNVKLFQQVIQKSTKWASDHKMMYVVGATKAEYIALVREAAPTYFLLVPGIGAQGGNLRDVCSAGLNEDIGLLVNSSRSILYADDSVHYAAAAANVAREMSQEMALILSEKKLL